MNYTHPPSGYQTDFSLIFQWPLVIAFLLFLAYAARKIKNEKKNYLDDCQNTLFGPFSFPVPRWWTLKQGAKDPTYYRADTRYDWYFRYSVESNIPDLDALGWLKSTEKIEFDPDRDLTMNAQNILLNFGDFDKIAFFRRIEGKATINMIDRAYIDIVFIQLHGHRDIHVFRSQSSVLNGMLEGPFFDESLKYLKFA
jgi:hypothetical protein